jgi:hypothetical protein
MSHDSNNPIYLCFNLMTCQAIKHIFPIIWYLFLNHITNFIGLCCLKKYYSTNFSFDQNIFKCLIFYTSNKFGVVEVVIVCNLCLSPLKLWVRTPFMARCDKVCQWLSTGRWFSPVIKVSSTNKTACHNITEILLKVALITINQPNLNTDSYKSNYHAITTIMVPNWEKQVFLTDQ